MITAFDQDENPQTVNNKTLRAKDEDPRWAEGPFYDIKYKMGPKIKGSVFERLTSEILTSLGVSVTGSDTNKQSGRKSTDYDRIINGSKYEIKGSCASTAPKDPNTGQYTFLQIRPDQEYDALLLVTFWHDGTVSMYSIPKEQVKKFIKAGVFKKQHGGNAAESGTYSYNGTIKPFEQYHVLTRKVVGGDIADPETKPAKQRGVKTTPTKAPEPAKSAKSQEQRQQELADSNRVVDTIKNSPELQQLLRQLKNKGADMESSMDDIEHYILQGLSPKEVVASVNELYESRTELNRVRRLLDRITR